MDENKVAHAMLVWSDLKPTYM